MAFLINNQTVIDNGRNLTNIASFDSTVTSTWDRITSTSIGNLLENREYFHITAANQSISLPPFPAPGWEVVVSVENFNNTTVLRNGSKIMGLEENMTIDVPYATVTFLYVNSTQGWRIY